MKNYIKILAVGLYFSAFSTYAVNTWTINSTNASISGLPNGSTSNSGSFVNGDNLTITTTSYPFYILYINQDATIGDLQFSSGTDPMQLEPGQVDIGQANLNLNPTLTLKPTTKNTNISYVNFLDENNKLILDSTSLAPNQVHAQQLGNYTSTSYAQTKYAPTFIGTPDYFPLINIDNYGNLELHSSNINPLGYSFPISHVNVSPPNRLKSLTYSGNGLIEGDVTQSIYAVSVAFNTSGQVIMPPLSMGDGSSITLMQDLNIALYL